VNLQRDRDLRVACPTCGATVGEDCKLLIPIGTVHFDRRLNRLLEERAAAKKPVSREELARELADEVTEDWRPPGRRN
jgi:hypothetical protein